MRLNEELKTKIFESLGAASMCWSETPKGIFESTRCKQIGDDLVSALEAEEAPASAQQAIAGADKAGPQIKPVCKRCRFYGAWERCGRCIHNKQYSDCFEPA